MHHIYLVSFTCVAYFFMFFLYNMLYCMKTKTESSVFFWTLHHFSQKRTQIVFDLALMLFQGRRHFNQVIFLYRTGLAVFNGTYGAVWNVFMYSSKKFFLYEQTILFWPSHNFKITELAYATLQNYIYNHSYRICILSLN